MTPIPAADRSRVKPQGGQFMCQTRAVNSLAINRLTINRLTINRLTIGRELVINLKDAKALGLTTPQCPPAVRRQMPGGRT